MGRGFTSPGLNRNMKLDRRNVTDSIRLIGGSTIDPNVRHLPTLLGLLIDMIRKKPRSSQLILLGIGSLVFGILVLLSPGELGTCAHEATSYRLNQDQSLIGLI